MRLFATIVSYLDSCRIPALPSVVGEPRPVFAAVFSATTTVFVTRSPPVIVTGPVGLAGIVARGPLLCFPFATNVDTFSFFDTRERFRVRAGGLVLFISFSTESCFSLLITCVEIDFYFFIFFLFSERK